MSDALKYVSEELASFSEIDWSEDSLTLRLRSDGKFTPSEEIAAWGHSFAEVSLNLAGKIGTSYSLSEQQISALMISMKESFIFHLDRLVDEQF